jgi:hypothetical protein
MDWLEAVLLGLVQGLTAAQNIYKVDATLPESPAEGTIVFLTAADGAFAANDIVIYKDGAWQKFNGDLF